MNIQGVLVKTQRGLASRLNALTQVKLEVLVNTRRDQLIVGAQGGEGHCAEESASCLRMQGHWSRDWWFGAGSARAKAKESREVRERQLCEVVESLLKRHWFQRAEEVWR